MKVRLLILSIILSMYSSVVFASGELNIYSSRHYEVDEQLIKDFEKQTGIKVNVLNDKTASILKKIEVEGAKTKADLIIAADAVGPYTAKNMGLLQKVDSKFLMEVIPAELQDKDEQVFAFTKRVRVIIYNKNKIKPSELSTYEDLANPKWKGRMLQRPSNNSYNEFLLSSIIARDGEAEALTWAKGIVANLARNPKGGDRDQFRAIVQGAGDLTLGNTYYLGLMINSKDEADRKVAKELAIFFPNQTTSGAHVNISAVGLIKYSKNKENAIKFMEFLLSQQAQEAFANQNYEYPINKNVKPSKTLASFGKFKEDSMSLEKIASYQPVAVRIFDQAGWK